MPIPSKFDNYEILTREDASPFELGRGAMGITYKAFDTTLRIPVALKVINGANLDSEIARERFVREARSAAQLRHPHVASVFHLGIENDTYFYVMEFIDGETVEALVRRQGALAPLLALQITTQVARALGAAQRLNLVHRDLKPANLMLVREDEEVCAKVIDFGLAISDKADASEVNASGFVGTPYFASPEQLTNSEVDTRSDIYSLGITLWYMVTGRTPFSGSLGQVTSQHLHKPLPIEQLGRLPSPLIAVLARMLEKSPANRPETPAVLRKELDACIQTLSGGGAPMESDPQSQGPLLKPGSALADRYEIISEAGEGSLGMSYHARQLASGMEVRVTVLSEEFIGSSAAYTRIEQAVERARQIEHPNLTRIFSLERLETLSLLISEWTRGFSVLELLRNRRELSQTETLLLLKQAATGADYAATAGLGDLDMSLAQMFLHFPGGEEDLLQTPVYEWPPFVLKLNPLRLDCETSLGATWQGGQTMSGDAPARPSSGGAGAPSTAQVLGTIARELLGGTAAARLPGAAAAYTPLANLSEEGNQILRRAMEQPAAFASAQALFEALDRLEKAEGRRPEARIVTARSPGTSVHSASTHATVAAREPVSSGGGRGRPWLAPCVVAAAAAGAVAFYLMPRTTKQPLVATSAPRAVEVSPTPSVMPAPSAPAVERGTPLPAVTPQPTAEVAIRVSTPSPALPQAPTRQQLLAKQIATAEQFEEAGNWPECLEAYLKAARDFPESDTGRVRLALVLDHFRSHPEAIQAMDFEALRRPLIEAAKLDIVSAMMLLGSRLRKEEPATAFTWYLAAAEKGQAQAMTQTGLMYSNGSGVARDYAKAAGWFQQASDKDDMVGRYCLAECLLYGRGLAPDEPRAVDLLKQASVGGEPRAMDLLGTCYAHGRGGLRKDVAEAFRLYSQAAGLHYWDSLANLGALYINGDGPLKDPAKAAEKAAGLFQEGIKNGSAACTFYYARCLESGVGVPADADESVALYKRAAASGYRPAIQWCSKHNIPVPEASGSVKGG